MIRHRPFGSGHPYALTGDQRVPPRPLDGQVCELRVRASQSVSYLQLEWSQQEASDAAWHTDVHRMTAPESSDVAQAADTSGGHLAAAQARAAADLKFWRAQTPALSMDARYRYRFVAQYDSGRVTTSRWYDLPVAAWAPDGGHLEVVGTDRVIPGSVEWLVDVDGPQRVRFALPLAPEEHVVGFGERYDAVDQRGRRLDAVVFEQYKQQEQHARTYLPMPFATVVGADGWGFHIRTGRRTWYDVGATTPDRIVVEAELGGEPKLEIRCYDGGPAQVLDAFLGEVGRPEMLPDWVFGLWASGNEWNTQARVMTELDRHATEDIPVGAVVIEAWSDESTFTAFRDATYQVNEDGAPHRLADFTFPAEGAWPDPKEMVEELHRRGVRVVLWQIPLMKTRGARGQLAADVRAAVEHGLVVTEADGRPYRNRGWWFPLTVLPDLSTQQARDWWTAKRRYLVEDLDIDGFKTDGGEHPWGHDLRYGDGSRGDDGNNRYPVHYARAYGDLLRAAGKAPVTFSRAGYTGSQAHGLFWAGDQDSTWQSLRAAITAGVSASACGVLFWGWDLAGFSGEVSDAELYLRAAAAATFMPVMQYHSEFNHHRRPLRDRTPWNVAECTGDDRVIPVFRKFAHLRERLVPYLSAETDHAINTGATLMRGMFFDHPDDPEIWRWPHQFMLGRDLLVAPVVTPGTTTWTTYLPAGTWVDVRTGDHAEGPRTLSRPVPLDDVPVFCRHKAWPQLRHVFDPLGA